MTPSPAPENAPKLLRPEKLAQIQGRSDKAMSGPRPAAWNEDCILDRADLIGHIAAMKADAAAFELLIEQQRALIESKRQLIDHRERQYAELVAAADSFRDAVLNGRGRFEAPTLDNEQTNAVLREYDDTIGAALAALSPAPPAERSEG